MKAPVTNVKRFAVHDGDGIRTTVFFKGCPLHCLWCHNPECISFSPEIAFREQKCVLCGECARVCPTGAHTVDCKGHSLDRNRCAACGSCANVCPVSALSFYGKERTPEELLPLLLEDAAFYRQSGGGVTLSGGECLCYPDFCAELLRLLKQSGVSTAVDTCGFVPRESIDKVIPFTDVFLYDIKAMDESVHKKCTGASNKLILDNLRYIDSLGKSVEIRIPYVPDYNADELPAIAEFVKTLSNVKRVRVLPYHNYAGSKYVSLGLENTLPSRLPTPAEITAAEELFK